MRLNLVKEPWIPVIHRSGQQTIIRPAEIAAAHRDMGDAPAAESRGEPAAHGFDLGQFRHPAATVARVRPLGYGRRHGLRAR